MSEPDPELLTLMNTSYAVVRHYGRMHDGVARFWFTDGRWRVSVQERAEFCKFYCNKPGPGGHKNLARWWLGLEPIYRRTYIWMQWLPGDARHELPLGPGGEEHVYICNLARFVSERAFTQPPESRETIGWRARLLHP